MPKLHIYKTEKETYNAFADWLTHLVKETLIEKDKFTIALSGTDISKQLYKVLEAEYADKIDWSKVHVFGEDEKLVSLSDERDAAASALKIFADHVHLPQDQIHSIKTIADPEEAAKQYESLLQSYFSGKENTFDLVILGISEEGNLLSLVSNNEENNYGNAWVIPVYDKHEDLYKISLTIEAINASSVKAFLVTGKRKDEIVQQVLKGKYEPEKYPAQLIITTNQSVHWFLDESAASKLIRPSS